MNTHAVGKSSNTRRPFAQHRPISKLHRNLSTNVPKKPAKTKNLPSTTSPAFLPQSTSQPSTPTNPPSSTSPTSKKPVPNPEPATKSPPTNPASFPTSSSPPPPSNASMKPVSKRKAPTKSGKTTVSTRLTQQAAAVKKQTLKTNSPPTFVFDKPEFNVLYNRSLDQLSKKDFLKLLKITPPRAFSLHLDYFQPELNELFDGRETPLIAVVKKSNLDMVRELVNNRGSNINQPGADGDSPLHVAIKTGNDELVRWLIAHGADVHQVNPVTNFTPLMTVTRTFHNHLVDILVNRSAHINQQNIFGQTALMIAAQFSTRLMIEQLYKNNADINLFDNDGFTAYDYALRHKKTEMSRIVRDCFGGYRGPKFNPLSAQFEKEREARELKKDALEVKDRIFDAEGKFKPEFIQQIWKAVQHSKIYQETGVFPDFVDITVKKHKSSSRYFTSHQGESRAPGDDNNTIGHHPILDSRFDYLTAGSDEITPLEVAWTSSSAPYDPFDPSTTTQTPRNVPPNEYEEVQEESYVIGSDGSVTKVDPSPDPIPQFPGINALNTHNSPHFRPNSTQQPQQYFGFSTKQPAVTESTLFSSLVNPFTKDGALTPASAASISTLGLSQFNSELGELQRQHAMLNTTQDESQLIGRRSLRGSQDYVVTKMKVESPYKILQNNDTVAFSQNQRRDRFPSQSVDLKCAEDDANLSLDNLHTTFSRKTLNKSKALDQTMLSNPVKDQFGKVLNPKFTTDNDFQFLLQQSASNKSMLLTDYMKKARTHRQRLEFRQGFEELKTLNHVVEKDGKMVQQSAKNIVSKKIKQTPFYIEEIDDSIDQQMFNIAQSIDNLEGKAGLLTRNQSIDLRNTQQFRRNQVLFHKSPNPLPSRDELNQDSPLIAEPHTMGPRPLRPSSFIPDLGTLPKPTRIIDGEHYGIEKLKKFKRRVAQERQQTNQEKETNKQRASTGQSDQIARGKEQLSSSGKKSKKKHFDTSKPLTILPTP